MSVRSTRRSFLGACLRAGGGAATAALLSPCCAALAQEPREKYALLLPRVRFNSDERVSCPWNIYPGGDRNLLEEFARHMRVEVKLPPQVSSYRPMLGEDTDFNGVVDFFSDTWFNEYPMVFMTGEGAFNFSSKEQENFTAYIERGGFVLMDDCVYDQGGDFFYQSAFRLLQQCFGPDTVVPVPQDHEIFTSVFNLSETGLPYVQGQPHGARGVFVGDRLAVFLSSSDLHCGWADRERVWFKNPEVYDNAIKMGINILAYAAVH
jgi:hypothetical protein